MALYQEAATPIALEQGVNPIAWFDIEGVQLTTAAMCTCD